MLISFLLNLLSLLFSVSPLKAFISILSGFSQQEVVLSLLAPILQVIITVSAFVLWLYFAKKEKENKDVKYSKAISYTFIVLAPILFFTTYLVSASFIYNLAATPSSNQNIPSITTTSPNTNPNITTDDIKKLTPSDVANLASSTPLNDYQHRLPQGLVSLEPNAKITPDQNYTVVVSRFSQDKNKLVYVEWSSCLDTYSIYNPHQTPNYCNDWEFRVIVQNVASGLANKIFEYSNLTSKPSLYNFFFIPTAYAGGCPLVPFPMGWSTNDLKIILEANTPFDCGSGGAPHYPYFTLSPNGGSLETLATYPAFFFDNFGTVVYSDNSKLSPVICGPSSDNNNGKIVMKSIETGQITTLIETPNTLYNLLREDYQNRNFVYATMANKKDTASGCGMTDYQKQSAEKQFTLP